MFHRDLWPVPPCCRSGRGIGRGHRAHAVWDFDDLCGGVSEEREEEDGNPHEKTEVRMMCKN